MRLTNLLLAALSCGLGTVNADDPKSKPSTQIVVEISNDDLVGKWQVTQLKQKEGEISLQSISKPPQFDIKLTNNKISYEAFLGCNHLTASGILKENTITFNQSAASFKFCPDAMEAEMALGKLISKPLNIQIQEDGLLLSNTLGQIKLSKPKQPEKKEKSSTSAKPSQPKNNPPSSLSEKQLEGNYTAITMNKKALNSLSLPQPMTINITGNRFRGYDGCNSYGGQYKLVGQTFVIEDAPSSTLMLCPETEEYPLLDFLESRPQVKREKGKLILLNKDQTWVFLEK